MTKSILLITFGLSTLFATNTVSQNISEKMVEQRVQKRQYQVGQRDHRTERKSQRQRVEQRQHRIEKKNQHQRIKNRNNRSEQRRSKAQRKYQQQKMDRNLRKRDAVKRNFRTHSEFKRLKRQHYNVHQRIHHKPSKAYRNNRRAYDHRGYRHYRQAWYFDFYYDRAPFYDRYGYYYGYFNRMGYFLEGIFYRYDRYYTFHDRVRGRGIFDHRYYRPYIYDDYYDYDDPYYR